MEAFSSKILFDSSSLDQLNPCPSTTIYDSNYNKSSILDQPNNALSSSSHKQDIMISSSPLPNKNNNNNNNNNNVVNYYNNMMEYSSSLLTHDHKVVTPIINKTKYSSKHKHPSSPNSAQSTKDVREAGKKQKKGGKLDNGDDEEKKEYIHVRARRGQATDSHSLAERVRRERISERMKQLQALVPGCDKITGKALMLDEIINYVQSLQNQVEFLSMKLASVNPMFYDFGMDLESFMVGPQQQNLSIEECSTTTANPYPDLLLQQAQIPNVALQVHNNRKVLWEVEDQRQRIINQSEISNNLFSFH